MWPLYYAGIYSFVFAMHIASLWNEKANQWVSGRNNWKEDLKKIPSKKNFRVWFHVSSLGEFEQARPVIESIKQRCPSTEIVLSFFSPSGFIHRKDFSLAHVLYLPSDLPGHARQWIRALAPDMAVFVKYDLWPGFLKELHQSNIPCFLIAANWTPGRIFSSWSFSLTAKLLQNFKTIFLQRADHLKHFEKEGFQNLMVAGDTRIDRSISLPQEAGDRIPEGLKSCEFDLVAGSTWPPDEDFIDHAIEKLKLKVLLAPHDVSASNLSRIKNRWKDRIEILSEINHHQIKADLILIDSIGLLAYLYSLGKVAYVGGGFGRGIHNTLEPMSHEKAVVFGPYYHHFPEAIDGVNQGFAFSVKTKDDFTKTLKMILEDKNAIELGARAGKYISMRSGATAIVTNKLMESIPCEPV